MKKSLLVLTTAVMAMVFASCDSFVGIKMDTPQAAEKVIESLNKSINFDEWKIYELSWCEGEALENKLHRMYVSMVNENNDCFEQTFILGGSTAGHVGDLTKATGLPKKIDFATFEGITPDMINPELFQKQYDEAKATIPAEYKYRSVGDRCMRMTVPSGNSNKKGVLEQEFTIHIIEPGNEHVVSNGKRKMQYFRAIFNVLADGSIELED